MAETINRPSEAAKAAETGEVVSKNFIEREIDKDLAEGVYTHVSEPGMPAVNAQETFYAQAIDAVKQFEEGKKTDIFQPMRSPRSSAAEEAYEEDLFEENEE